MYTHYFIYICCALFFLTTVTVETVSVEVDDDKFYCNIERGIYYNERGYATTPIEKDLTDKVADIGYTGDNTMLQCLAENEVIYEDFLRLINMDLPTTHQGKADKDYTPKTWFIINLSGPLTTLINILANKLIFPGDSSIYEGIDTTKYLKKAVAIGVDCMKKYKHDRKDKCESIYKLIECASEHEHFASLREDTFLIRKQKLADEKKKNAALTEIQSKGTEQKQSITT